ncbi:hypothetical protein ACFY5D_21260 [Paeniglutamicibacter sp. NPDC012692]|uniref:hypothetical protein n=1 Tax=Paeniglutamicibacter sp. NPDC012692 TaxID=3364388 RepID=UPI0036A94BB9
MSVKPAADGTPQKRLNFDVPDDLAREFKAYAALQGKSQRELVLAFMQRCVRRMPAELGHRQEAAPVPPDRQH